MNVVFYGESAVLFVLADTGTGPRSEKCCVFGSGLFFPFLNVHVVMLYCICMEKWLVVCFLSPMSNC